MALAVVPITEPGPYIIQFDALYCREAFDGEKPLRKELLIVAAVEQAFHISQAPFKSSHGPTKSVLLTVVDGQLRHRAATCDSVPVSV